MQVPRTSSAASRKYRPASRSASTVCGVANTTPDSANSRFLFSGDTSPVSTAAAGRRRRRPQVSACCSTSGFVGARNSTLAGRTCAMTSAAMTVFPSPVGRMTAVLSRMHVLAMASW
ncbi:hypothetical protein J4439_05160 [Candidatus Woesearchaeota archaeon]|nr:hypothetical protein [Candidatus Woesearchaeota archaeon]